MPEPSAQSPVDDRAAQRRRQRLAQLDTPPWLHQETARRMAERLALVRERAPQWLDWQGGVSGSAEAVQAVWPQARRDLVEPDEASVRRSRQALQRPWWSLKRLAAGQASQVHGEDELPPQQARMLWANLVLQASADVPALLAQWHRALAVGGFVMFSTLGPDTWRELRAVYAANGWPLPHAPFTDMHDIGDALVQAGFADPVMDQELLTLTWSSPEALLAELHGLGGNLARQRFAGLRTPRWRERLKSALAERAGADGRIAMSVELVYGHAFKAAPRAARGEIATVSLDSLRSSLPPRPPRR